METTDEDRPMEFTAPKLEAYLKELDTKRQDILSDYLPTDEEAKLYEEAVRPKSHLKLATVNGKRV